MASTTEDTVDEPTKSIASNAMAEHAIKPKSSPSIVADVLSKKGLNAADAINQAMKDLAQKTDGLKSQIYGAIYKQYTEFYHEFNLEEELNKKLGKLVREINKLGDDIQNDTLVTMSSAGSELEELTKEYDKNQEVIKALKKLCKIHDCIQTCANGLHFKDYLLAAKAVRDMRTHLNDLSSGTCDIKIFKAVREEYRRKKAFLMSSLEANWSKLIEWNTVTSASRDSIEGHLKTSLTVRSPAETSDKSKSYGVTSLISLYDAMDYIGIFDARLKTFAKKMLNFLLKPFIMFPSAQRIMVGAQRIMAIIDLFAVLQEFAEARAVKLWFGGEGKFKLSRLIFELWKHKYQPASLKPLVDYDKVLQIRITKEDKKVKGRRPDPASLYRKLAIVIRFITTNVFQNAADEEKKNNSADKTVNDESRSVACRKLQSLIWTELSDLIIKECLSGAVPTNNSQLEEYEMVIKLTSTFERELVALGFLDDSCTTLSSYVKDINVHFANKKCQDLLVRARDLMTSEIHSMVKVEADEDRARLITLVDEKEKKLSKETRLLLAGLKDIPGSSLGTKLFQFPECRISESTQKLMKLVYDTLIEGSSASPQVAIQLFYSVRKMFELFCDVVPIYHRESLELPQMAALHYNNSMYLAHNCITLGHQFKPTHPEALSQGAATFVDLVPVIRKCGEKCFLANLQKQKLQLLEIIRECNGFADLDTEECVFTTQKAFEQIINQLVRLSRVWTDVLPQHIYEKCLGLLFHTVLDDIVSQIVQLEDISAEQGTQFYRLLKILVDRSGEIFNLKSKDENSTEDMGFIVNVPSWQKFNEVITMMDSSLQGIVDRWADGKGPLAQCFDAADVKCLVKALFQNTNRRAQALSKIKQT